MASFWQSGWASAQTQWRSNARLRAALLLALALLWVSLLFAWSDRIDSRLAAASELRAVNERNKPLGRDKSWPARADGSAKQLALLRSMLWREPDLGLAEAALQDDLRALATRTGVLVRELKVARVGDRARAGTEPIANPPPPGAASYPELRARMLFEFRRDRVVAMLMELSQRERAIVIDRLLIRSTSQPPMAELDVRVVVDTTRQGKP